MIDLLIIFAAVAFGFLFAAVVAPTSFAVVGHYTSTYCLHGLHEDCRLTCKHCERSCRCRCHRSNQQGER